MTTTAISSDTLPSSIPKLDARGKNWMIFSIHFKTAVKAKGKWDHFIGSNPKPVFPTLPVSEFEETLLNTWSKDECTTQYLLTQRIPDSTIVRMQKFTTVADQWASIVAEYTLKGTYAQKDMRQSFMEMCCDSRGDVQNFLDDLHTK
ncbi:hypothetical protein EW146_g4254 [Bondarzewia mesenterica]|uniref:Uncharacterized protein n=1 Tax=Bondarzewia mesenterica TaxID=1095465 RepID=A0A4S4LVL9_9AGAM|nr:hypothetical protein EW146_g4254 [Bondarzewia mesenterica]